MQNKVIHGNCHDILDTLPANTVQTVFIDPPYNIGIDYGNGRRADLLPEDKYLSGIDKMLRASLRLLTDTGSIWLLSPERWADQIGSMLSELLPRRNRIIWRETFGQYRETAFPNGHRHLFWHVRARTRTPFYTDEIRIPSRRMQSGDNRACGPRVPDDVWEIPRLVGNSHERIGEHPCQLPEALLERIVLASTRPTDLLLDPMSGTGTALRVAQRLGRNYIGIEEQEAFVRLIERRLSNPYQTHLFA